MKKIGKAETCVCWSGERNAENDWWDGMPHLKIVDNGLVNNHAYVAYCPKCGRGGIIEFPTVYKALKDWNEMQQSLKTPINFFVDEGECE